MTRPTITLAMIVKNEAENLPRVFGSVMDCFDEVRITDTGSTDNTVEIAEKCGAKVSHFEWCNDFSAARNYSFKDVKTDFVCWLDGDDVLENPAGFRLFRDTVMGLADYWIATYHYSSDANGKAVCSFARERVFRVSKGLQWKYPIHEGVLPDNVRSQFTPSWAVRHMRTSQDLEKDRSRNLKLFESIKAKGLDPRMQYYYGKELFEAGKPIEATKELLEAAGSPLLEPHDRILALQYACYAYIQCNQFEMAVQIAHQGLQLNPQRAEFYSLIGDCYLKLGKIENAIPYFSAAKNCRIQIPTGYSAPIFHNEELYSVYPANQLARIYANIGDLEKGVQEAKEVVEKYQNGEAKAIYDEIIKIRDATTGYKNAVPCEDIVITTPPQNAYTWDADIAKSKAMGGSETAAIEMAKHLHKLSGRPVKIFNMRDTDVVCDGVEYISNAKVNEYMCKNKPWLHIAWRHNIKLTDAPTFLWCHDLTTPGAEQHANYEKILCLTPFHKRYVMAMQNIPEYKIHVTRNGIKPELFLGSKTKNPNKIVFPSSPDRGLDRAMRVLDKVREKYPEVELHVFYGIEHLHKWGLGSLADKLKAMMGERPWVKYHGATQQDVLIEHFKEAALWLHPCDFVETSCITAMEMVCCGVYPVTRRLGGLMDTLSVPEKVGMATLIDSDCVTDAEYQLYVDATIRALDEKSWERVTMDARDLSWESVAQEWLETLPFLGETLGRTA